MPHFNSTSILGDLKATGIIKSTVATGTSPLSIASQTLVNNLNVEYLNGQLGSYYLAYANLTGAPTSLKNPNALTIGSGLSGTSYDGSAAVTIAHSNIITAGNFGDTGVTRTLGYSGTFIVPYITYDLNGHLVTKSDLTLTLPAGTDLSWTAGTTAGPTVNSSTGADAVIPSASATASGVITTTTQEIAGEKTFRSTLNVGSGVANTAFIKLRTDQAGSPQITMTDYFGDMTWAIGGDDGDNSFKIHGTANDTETMINNLVSPFFEITTSGNTITRTGMLYAESGIGRLPASWDAVVTDIAGNDLTLQSGAGTGTGASSKIYLKTSDPTTTGSANQTLTTRVTVDKVNTTIANNLVVSGDLTVQGDTITMNTGTIFVEDKNIELGKVDTPTDVTADGGGITLKGSTDKTITWLNSDDSWHFNQGIILDNTNLIFGTPNQRNALDLNNNKIIGVDSLSFSDSGPDGYIQIGSWSIWNSPNDLTTNTDGNFQFVSGGVRRASINTSGQLELPVATGTAPLLINSTTRVSNLNVASSGVADKVSNSLVIKSNSGTTEGTSLYTFDGSASKTLNLIPGTNVTLDAAAGSITFNASHPTITAQTSVNNSDGNVIQDVTLDSNGHVTGLESINLDNRFVRKYYGSVTGINNAQFYTIAKIVASGSDLNSIVKFTLSGTTGSTVVAVTGEIIKNHSQDYYIRTEAGKYTLVTLKITGNNDGDYWIQAKTESVNLLDMRVEIETFSDDAITIGTDTPSGTTYSVEHICYPHQITISSRDGATEINNQKVWTSGNDGAGSGLDADTFDGLNSSQFLRKDISDSTAGGLTIHGSLTSGGSTTTSAYVSGADNLILKGNASGVSGIFFESEKNGVNINHTSDYGFIQFHAYGVGGSEGESNRLVIGVSNDALTDKIVLNPPGINDLVVRIGAVATEYQIWHAQNDGSGSGLDADTFDGIESSQFLRSDETDTLNGDLIINGTLFATAKSFLIKHPTKENMKLRYGSLEGPENGVYFRGRLSKGNTIELPDYWKGLVREESITVNLTPINTFQKLFVKEINDNKISIENENILLHRDIDCYYTIFGERKDVEKLVVEIDQIN